MDVESKLDRNKDEKQYMAEMFKQLKQELENTEVCVCVCVKKAPAKTLDVFRELGSIIKAPRCVCVAGSVSGDGQRGGVGEAPDSAGSEGGRPSDAGNC